MRIFVRVLSLLAVAYLVVVGVSFLTLAHRDRISQQGAEVIDGTVREVKGRIGTPWLLTERGTRTIEIVYTENGKPSSVHVTIPRDSTIRVGDHVPLVEIPDSSGTVVVKDVGLHELRMTGIGYLVGSGVLLAVVVAVWVRSAQSQPRRQKVRQVTGVAVPAAAVDDQGGQAGLEVDAPEPTQA